MNRYEIALGRKPVREEVPSTPDRQRLIEMLSHYKPTDFPCLRRKLAQPELWLEIAGLVMSEPIMSGPGISGPHTFSIKSTPNTDMNIYRLFQDWASRVNPQPPTGAKK